MPLLADLVRDAHRFVLFNKPAIEIAPLQVYVSALVFSPARSLIKRLFENEAPRWIMLKPAIEAGWNACMQTLEGHGEEVLSVAFSADGQRIVSGSQDRTIKIWDAATGSLLQTLEGHEWDVNSVVFSADNRWVISSSTRVIKIWDAATGGCLQTFEGDNGGRPLVASLADG
jgi:WD40 repeat protein